MPAAWGDSSTGELCFRSAEIRVQLPAAPPMLGTCGPPRRFAASLPQRESALRADRRAQRTPFLVKGANMSTGAVAQTGERLDGIEKVAGAIPVSSTASNAGEDYITIMVLR